MTSPFEDKLISRVKNAAERLEMIKPPVDYTVNRVRKALAGLIKPDYIDVWLSTPNPAFGDRTPYSLIEDGREDEIWNMIHELNTGMPG